MSRSIRVLPDAQGEMLELDPDWAALRTTRSSPPGSTLLVELGEGHRLELKVKSCRRSDHSELGFRIEGKLVNLSRAGRERLLEWARAAGLERGQDPDPGASP
jgi:hypothetical protein